LIGKEKRRRTGVKKRKKYVKNALKQLDTFIGKEKRKEKAYKA
jgi:hypothetical protein